MAAPGEGDHLVFRDDRVDEPTLLMGALHQATVERPDRDLAAYLRGVAHLDVDLDQRMALDEGRQSTRQVIAGGGVARANVERPQRGRLGGAGLLLDVSRGLQRR